MAGSKLRLFVCLKLFTENCLAEPVFAFFTGGPFPFSSLKVYEYKYIGG